MIFSKKFIKASNEMCELKAPVAAPLFRRAFELAFVPEKAEITVTGLGFYELWINGKNVTKGPLAPYISNPDQIVYYDNYDITDLLTVGENVIGIELGNGFRNPYSGFIWDFEKATFRGPVTFALALEATRGEDKLLVEADGNFKTHPSALLRDDLRLGCLYDARLEIPGWNLPGFDDGDWAPVMPERAPAGDRRLCLAEPIAETRVLRAVKIEHFDESPFAYRTTQEGAAPYEQSIRKNVYVFDFGVNTTGVTSLHLKGARPGQRIEVRHGETYQNGTFSENTTIFNRPNCIDRYLEYAQCDVYICRGGDEDFLPIFKYDGFRYAFVTGLENLEVTADTVLCHEMHSALKERAAFASSSETLNRLFEMTRRSDLGNFFYFPTDCPHREKNGWTGDANMSAAHLLLNLDCANSLSVWLENFRRAQREAGNIPAVVPTAEFGYGWGSGPSWDAAAFTIPYEIYRFTGDVKVIRDNAPMLLRYLNFLGTKRNADGLFAFGLGDWLDPFKEVTGKIRAPLVTTDSLMVYRIATRAAFLFEKIGLIYETKYAEAFAADLRRTIREKLVDFSTMTVFGDCETTQAFALCVGIFDAEELPAARKKLVDIIHAEGDINTCGMIGIRYLFRALIDAGEVDLAYRLTVSEHRTSYGSWVKRGATTLLENWAHEDGRELQSMNHHFFGDISAVMVERFAGLYPNPDATDASYIRFAPQIPEGLTFAEASFENAFGGAFIRWEKKDGALSVTLTVPDGMHADFIAPPAFRDDAAPAALSAGTYRFSLTKSAK